jgi:hypothetical protein
LGQNPLNLNFEGLYFPDGIAHLLEAFLDLQGRRRSNMIRHSPWIVRRFGSAIALGVRLFAGSG